MGVIEFEFQDNLEILQVYFFKIIKFSGKPKESDEIRPRWFRFRIDKIPFTKMWPDDIYWIPMFLRGEKFKRKLLFDENDKILKFNLKKIKSLK